MNLYQRAVLLLAALAIGFMALFPPWIFVFQGGAIKTERFAGYHPIWQANTPTDTGSLAEIFSLPHGMVYANRDLFSIRIDSTRLSIQIVAVLLVSLLVTVLFKRQSVQ